MTKVMQNPIDRYCTT